MRVAPYNREKAVAYAHKWAFGRNPAYYNFDKLGGDCTNFVSQCIFNGDAVMNYTPVLGWYYVSVSNRSPSWTGVEFLYKFITNNKGLGPFAEEVSIRDIEPGDFIQLKFGGDTFRHTLFVVKTGATPDVSNILVSTHTIDSDSRPLSSYSWSDIRFVHILGVRR